MRRYAKLLLREGAAEVSALIELIDIFARDQPRYLELVEKQGRDKRTKDLLKAGFFAAADLFSLLMEVAGETIKGARTSIVDHALQRLCDHGFVNDNHALLGQRAIVQYNFNKKLLSTMNWDPVLAENICCGWLFIVDRYRQSVPALTVLTEAGDEAVATAFLMRISRRNDATSVLVTNKHVAGASVISRVVRAEAAGAVYGLQRFVTSARYDLAAIEVAVPAGVHHFVPFQGFLLDEVVTLGYPRVAVASEHRLLAHKGEVNGTIVDRYDKNEYQVISCAVAPGNSGGPVIDDSGRVVGVVCQSSIGRYLRTSPNEMADESPNDVGVHHLALPIGALADFLDREVPIQLSR